MSRFLEMPSAKYIPHWCRDQEEGGCSERSGCPLIHLREIESERRARQDVTRAAPASWKEETGDHRRLIF